MIMVQRLLILLIVSWSIESHYACAERISAFSSVCVEEDGVGYNWKNSQWSQVNFIEDTLVIRKISPNEEYVKDSNPEGCFGLLKKDDLISKEFAFTQACYRGGELGGDQFSSWC